MAVLSKNGREVTRWVRERETPDDEHVSWRRCTLSERANGWILRKDDVRFRPTTYQAKPRLHNWGWKRFCRRSKTNPAKWYVTLLNAPEWRCVYGREHVSAVVGELSASALVGDDDAKAVA